MDNQKSKYLLGQYEKSMPITLSWKEKLEYCKLFGFDYLEMSIDETDEKLSRIDMKEQEINEIKQAIKESGIPILSICLSAHRKYPLGSLNEETREKSLMIMEKAIVLSVKLGVRLIQLAGYDVYYETSSEETRIQFMNGLKKCVEMASKYGVTLGFETMETAFMDTVKKAMNCVNEMNSPYLHVYPDIGNLKNASLLYGNSVSADLRIGKGHLLAAHLKETLVSHYREIEFGKGHTEFKENIQVLKDLGVRMFVGEFWYVGQKDWQVMCKQANQFLRVWLDSCFN